MLALVTVGGQHTAEYGRLYKESKALHAEMQRARGHLNVLEKSRGNIALTPESLDNQIGLARATLEKASKECREHATESEFAHLNKLKSGCELMAPLLKTYLGNNSKKPKGPGDFALTKALQNKSGAKFQKQNGGFDLTTQNGMNVLSNYDAVADVVESVYPPGSSLREKIESAFTNLRKLSKSLLDVSRYLKSQERRQLDDYLPKLNELILDWELADMRKMAGTRDMSYFIKLHHLMAHSPEFIRKYGMSGRVSEESFEAIHALISRIKKMVATMHGDIRRITSACSKAQNTLKKGVNDSSNKIHSSIHRYSQAGQPKSKQIDRVIASSSAAPTTHTFDGREFVDINDGKARIPKDWLELWLLISSGEVPRSWYKVFEDDATLHEAVKEDAKINIY